MALAIFDLDNTLIAGDSDHLWGEFLVAHKLVDADAYKASNDQFYQDYLNGRLDILAYQRFALKAVAQFDPDTLATLHRQYMDEVIEPLMLPKAFELLETHRSRGDFLLIITATNDFVTGPIAQRLGVDDMLATNAEQHNGRYTGDVAGTPCYREGKVVRLHSWLKSTGHSLEGSCFYSDSHNDLPLLETVDSAIAVDPDPVLDREARERGWPVISLRN
jgi:HAD superfamily hydrolase (TIGR01490 family)